MDTCLEDDQPNAEEDGEREEESTRKVGERGRADERGTTKSHT